MSKIQFSDMPEMLPQSCSICGCGSPDGRKYIDIGLSLDHYGVVYFCEYCMNEIIEGMPTTAVAISSIRAELKKVDKLNNLLMAKNEALNEQLRSAYLVHDIDSRIDSDKSATDSTDQEIIDISA